MAEEKVTTAPVAKAPVAKGKKKNAKEPLPSGRPRKATAVRGVEPPGECNVRRLFSSVFSVSQGRTAAGRVVSRPSPHRTSCARGY